MAEGMLSLVLSALRARRAQTLALFALTVLAALGGCAAPWFLGWSRDAVATADITYAPAGVYLGYRDDVCAHLSLRGACPRETGDVAVSGATAERLHLAVGDQVSFTGFRLPRTVTLTVTAIYEVADLTSDYWAGTDLLAGPGGVAFFYHEAVTTET